MGYGRPKCQPGPYTCCPSAPTSLPNRSRTARLRGLAQLTTLRATFATLERVAPRKGATKAIDLWCTLPHNAGRRRDLRPAEGEISRHPVPRGGEVVAESWGEGPTVYLVHGWGGWRGQLGAEQGRGAYDLVFAAFAGGIAEEVDDGAVAGVVQAIAVLEDGDELLGRIVEQLPLTLGRQRLLELTAVRLADAQHVPFEQQA